MCQEVMTLEEVPCHEVCSVVAVSTLAEVRFFMNSSFVGEKVFACREKLSTTSKAAYVGFGTLGCGRSWSRCSIFGGGCDSKVA